MFQTVVVVAGLLVALAVVLWAVRNARMAPKPGEWHGTVDPDAPRKRWSARSSAGFTDRGAGGA